MIIQILQSQPFITVSAGVLLFAISQWIIYTVINPHQAYLRAASDLSREMLKLTHKYTNFHLDETEVEIIRNANAAYLAAVWHSGWFGRKKRRANGFKVAEYINDLSNLGYSPGNEGEKLKSLIHDIAFIERLDKNLKIQYREKSN